MILVVLAVIVAVLAALAYLVGLFDRPDFVYREFLLDSKKELIALVVTSQDNNFAKHIPRIFQGTTDAIETSIKDYEKFFSEGAALYGAPKGAERTAVGLYFDDPKERKDPRWAIGWIVATKDFKEAQALAEKANKSSTIKERIVAVRIGPGPVLAARIPWRTKITPMIQPMFQWTRGFATYEMGKYKSSCGREGQEGSVALEVYVTGPNDTDEYIDYVVVMGDTKHCWDDTFPVVKKKQT